MATSPKCGKKLWRCQLCDRAVAAGPGNTKPTRCKTKGCPGAGRQIVHGTCRRAAGAGTGHVGEGPCKTHGGKALQVEVAARRRLLAREATEELARLGVRIDTTPSDALEAMLSEAAGNVVVFRELVQSLGLHTDMITVTDDGDITMTSTGLAGQIKLDSAEAKPHIWVVLYNQERDRLAHLAAEWARLGFDERRVRLAEAEVARLFDAFTGAMGDIGMTADQAAAFKQAVADRLRQGGSR